MPKSVKVETKYGPLELFVASGSYVRVRHVDGAPFTVRSKEYQVSVGVRVPQFELAEHASVNRRGDFSAFPVVAPTIKAAILSTCVDVVREYVTAHPEEMAAAGYERAREEYARADGDLTALLEQVEAKRAHVAELKAAMDAAAPAGPIRA